jgi:hypothetical protein
VFSGDVVWVVQQFFKLYPLREFLSEIGEVSLSAAGNELKSKLHLLLFIIGCYSSNFFCLVVKKICLLQLYCTVFATIPVNVLLFLSCLSFLGKGMIMQFSQPITIF